MRFLFLIFLMVCFGMTACANVPNANRIIAEVEENSVLPIVMSSGRALTTKQSQNLFSRMGVSDSLQHHLAIEQIVTAAPLVANNSARILHDGTQTFRAMFNAMKSARKSIHLEYYILEDIEYDGVKLSALLIKKRREGVAVNMIYDGFGSSSTPPAFFDRLKKARVNILQFNPLNPLMARTGYAPNSRDHRKILIVDGTIAIVGGVNLSTSYQSSAGKSSGPPDLSPTYWRDTDLEITGPAVTELEKLFMVQWINQNGVPLHKTHKLLKNDSRGTEIVRVIGSTPDKAIPAYYTTLLSAIRHAQKRIWLTSAYFVPTDQQMDDLTAAARHGVDVRLLLPDRSDAAIAVTIQRSHYHKLLKAGVKIYESHNVILHSKTAVIDGIWSVIGSSNFDYRSVVFNDEVDVIVLGHQTGQELERKFERDSAKAHHITLTEWKRRPLIERMKEIFQPVWATTVKSYL